MAIAIDFGTSNTVVARWHPVHQIPETLALPGLSVRLAENPPLVPSLLYVAAAAPTVSVVAGQQVRDQGLDNQRDPRCFQGFKRGIGAQIQGFLPVLDGQTISFEQVGQWFLSQVVEATRQMPLPVDSLVLTVPVDSFEAYRHWLGQVCQSLQIDQVRLLDEPTAAALGYGLTDEAMVLVVDFGGGTLDLSLVQLNLGLTPSRPLGFILKWGDRDFSQQSGQRPKVARVLAKGAQNLGGMDIDAWILESLAATRKLPVTPLTQRLAERLKIQLSTQSQAREVYFDDATLDSFDLAFSRDELVATLTQHDFFERLDSTLARVLQEGRRQGVTVKDIDAVLLVGGTTQMPAVQTWIQQHFEASQIRREKPFEAIAQGALQLAQGLELKDFLYHGYGIRYWDHRSNGHNWHSLIRPGQPYPMVEPVELILGASVANQPSIELVLGELGAETIDTEVFFDGDRLITRRLGGSQTSVQPLSDGGKPQTIAQLDPPGHPGSDRIKVLFQVDRDRFLRITVEDLFRNQLLLADQPVVQLR